MLVALDSSIRAYARRVDNVARYRESAEISALLAERESIRDALRAGVVVDASLRDILAAADARLLASASLVARSFPGFDAKRVVCEVIGVPAASEAR